VSNEDCSPEPYDDPNCWFFPDLEANGDVISSIMAAPFLDSVG
jgi:hypothetical protein